MKNTALLFALLLFALLVGGCSGDEGDDDDSNGGGITPSCAAGEFALEGTLDGQAVSQRGSVGQVQWLQGSEPNLLEAAFDGGGSLHAEWPEVVARGDTTTITGSIVLPPGGPRSGETLNYGSGSMQALEDAVTFELSALTAEVTCDTAPCNDEIVDGNLRGCAAWGQ
jgi:hypothetical protein